MPGSARRTLLPRAVLAAATAPLVLLALGGCSRGLEVSMSDPSPVPPASGGPSDGPSDGPGATTVPQDPASDPAPTDDVTDPATDPADPATDTGSGDPTKPAAWGGGRKVGRSATRGTVVGDDGSGPVKRIVVGTCDAARDVRTVTAPLPGGGLLVVDVTSANLAKISLTAPGEPKRSAEYVGDATPVVTLTPSRTIVRSALLVPPAGSDAAPVRVDATFDC